MSSGFHDEGWHRRPHRRKARRKTRRKAPSLRLLAVSRRQWLLTEVYSQDWNSKWKGGGGGGETTAENAQSASQQSHSVKRAAFGCQLNSLFNLSLSSYLISKIHCPLGHVIISGLWFLAMIKWLNQSINQEHLSIKKQDPFRSIFSAHSFNLEKSPNTENGLRHGDVFLVASHLLVFVTASSDYSYFLLLPQEKKCWRRVLTELY